MKKQDPECITVNVEISKALYQSIQNFMAQRPGWYSDLYEFITEAVRVRIFG